MPRLSSASLRINPSPRTLPSQHHAIEQERIPHVIRPPYSSLRSVRQRCRTDARGGTCRHGHVGVGLPRSAALRWTRSARNWLLALVASLDARERSSTRSRSRSRSRQASWLGPSWTFVPITRSLEAPRPRQVTFARSWSWSRARSFTSSCPHLGPQASRRRSQASLELVQAQELVRLASSPCLGPVG